MGKKAIDLAAALDSLRFLNQSTDDDFFLYVPSEGKMYFTHNIEKKHHLPPMHADNSYTVESLIPAYQIADKGYLCNTKYSITTLDGGTVTLYLSGEFSYDSDQSPMPIIGKITSDTKEGYTDPLTGLSNFKKLKEDIAGYINAGSHGFIMVIGIDNFKNINTKYGMDSGDAVLKSVAEAFARFSTDLGLSAYKMDSDKFCLLGNASSFGSDELAKLYDDLRSELAQICAFSSGIAVYGTDGDETAGRVLLNAETAMYYAKKSGRGTQVFFSEEILEKQLDTIDLQEELKMSIHNNFSGFYLKYQPQVDCQTCEIRGFETLLRYVSPKRGSIPTCEVIEVLEGTGLISYLLDWTVEEALKNCCSWRKYLPKLNVSVNISYMQLNEAGFADKILNLLRKSGLPGNALTLEIIESMKLQDYPLFNRIFYRLKKAGVKISIDDFGSGYSNFGYLKALAIDEIKIDKSFISCIQHNTYNYRLLFNMIELAREASISVCCEGVETEEEFITIKELRPEILQGYFFSKPLTAQQFYEKYIDSASDAFRQRNDQIHHYQSQKIQNSYKNNKRRVQEKLSSIVDGMDEIVYVIDPQTHALLYLNAAGREISGCYDYKGQKCYELLMGYKEPCAECQSCNNATSAYSVWEMYNEHLKRHFLIKDKTISWQGKPTKLTIALDITEKEITSQKLQEKLDYESNIVACTKVLAEETDRTTAVDYLLRAIGEFYDAGRAYLFELQPNKQFWDNTSEWCAEGVIPQKDVLQDVPISTTARWLELFEIQDSIMIPDIDAIKETSPDEWATLEMQGIRSLIVSPIRKNHEVIGFIGVDDPKKHNTDNGQVQTIACFLADRMINDQTRERLNELLNLHYEDILQTTRLGLWVIRMSRDVKANQMFMDKTMREITCLGTELSPEGCYLHWYDRISPAYYGYVNRHVSDAIETGKIMRLSYPWIHPEKNITTVECVVIRIEDSDGMICLAGYHREMNEVDTPNFLPGAQTVIFEFDKETQSIYFHHGRGNLDGIGERESNFPMCWTENEIVHPHFHEEFIELFSSDAAYSDVNIPDDKEVLLKTKDGLYNWFSMHFQYLGTKNASTVIVMLNPAENVRALELEHLRQKDFYQAILSETIAYAEIDMESKRAVILGGIWGSYADEEMLKSSSYLDILTYDGSISVYSEDIDLYNSFLDEKTMFELIAQGKSTASVQLRHRVGDEFHWVELTGHIFCEGFSNQKSALIYMKDIDSKKRNEMAREFAATRDGLTKTFNRQAFEAEVEQSVISCDNSDAGTLLLIDMDDFKAINDEFGHIAGDTALQKFADILMITFRRKDIIGRMGGDEFMVFIKGLTDRETIDKRIEELNTALASVTNYNLKCSIGIAFADSKPIDYTELVRKADVALYHCKNNGKNTHCYFDDIE